MSQSTIEAIEGESVLLWKKSELEECLKNLQTVDPFETHPHDIFIKEINMDGFHFNVALNYSSPHKINYKETYLPFPEKTDFELAYPNGRPKILRSGLGFWLHRYDIPKPNGDDLTARLMYKLTFKGGKNVAGMLITDQDGNVRQERPLVEGKNRLLLPSDAEFLSQTRGMFMRSEYMVG